MEGYTMDANGVFPGTLVSSACLSYSLSPQICPLLHTLIDSQLGVIIKNILSKCGQNPKKVFSVTLS